MGAQCALLRFFFKAVRRVGLSGGQLQDFLGYNRSMTHSPCPDADGLIRGFTRKGGFRAVQTADHQRLPDVERGKWISSLPSSMPSDQRQEAFDSLAASVLLDPKAQALGCTSGKMALRALSTAPTKIALMFYCEVGQEEALKPIVIKHAKALREKGLAEGWLLPRDGHLGRWWFKTDAQTKAELAAGTHAAQEDRRQRLEDALLEMMGAFRPSARPKPKR